MLSLRWKMLSLLALMVLGAGVLLWFGSFTGSPHSPKDQTVQSISNETNPPRTAASGTRSVGVAASSAVPAGINSSVDQAFLAMANDPSIPADEREARILNEAKKGAAAVENLVALAEANTYFSYTAVQALGQIPTPEVQRHLVGKLKDPNSRVVNAAVHSLARIQGPAAVPAIVETLRNNRVRRDGFEDTVCASCVEALGDLKSSTALPALQEELTTTVNGSLGFDYGSKVVKAIEQISDPSAIPMLLTYMNKLRAEQTARAENPKAQQYLQSRLDEVQTVIRNLEQK